MTGSLGAVALMLISAVAWSVLDALRKGLATRVAAEPLVVWMTLGQVPLLALLWGAASPPGELDSTYLLVAGGSIALNVGASLALFAALRAGELSLVIPLLSLTPAVVTLLAIPILGELPSVWQLLGIALAVAGAFALAGGSLSAVRRAPGVGAMLVVVGCWSLTLPLDKVGVMRAGAALHGLVLCASMVVAMTLWLTFRGRLGELRLARTSWPLLLAAVAVATIALLTQLLAIEVALVAVVETVKRVVGNFGALALGLLAFRERLEPRRVLALVLMAAGAALVLLG